MNDHFFLKKYNGKKYNITNNFIYNMNKTIETDYEKLEKSIFNKIDCDFKKLNKNAKKINSLKAFNPLKKDHKHDLYELTESISKIKNDVDNLKDLSEKQKQKHNFIAYKKFINKTSYNDWALSHKKIPAGYYNENPIYIYIEGEHIHSEEYLALKKSIEQMNKLFKGIDLIITQSESQKNIGVYKSANSIIINKNLTALAKTVNMSKDFDIDKKYNIDFNIYFDRQKVDKRNIKSIFEHEFLHCLTLDHNKEFDSIMNCNRGVVNMEKDTFSARDIAKINKYYPPKPSPFENAEKKSNGKIYKKLKSNTSYKKENTNPTLNLDN